MKLFLSHQLELIKKKIKKYIDLVSSLKDKGYKVRYIMIGFLNDDYGSYLMNYVSTSKIRTYLIAILSLMISL